MIQKLENLSLILKKQIFRALYDVRNHEKKVLSLSQDLNIVIERIALIVKLRQEHFLSRSSVIDLDSLLEYLKTLQASLYKQHGESLRFLLKNSSRLSGLINRRKIIEKIKSNKYSKTKR